MTIGFPKRQPPEPEVIRAYTPIVLAAVGLVIGVAALFVPSTGNNDSKWSAAFGLAGTAIAGAAGLAQSTKNNEPPKSGS